MKTNTNQTIYSQLQRFADVTKLLIVRGNISRAKRCLGIAEQLFSTGNNEVRNAITNVYLFSVSSFMELHKCSIRNLFPDNLKAAYKKQVSVSGI
jgi:predicted transcriptional regulator